MLVLYFTHAYVESDVSEMGKLTSADVWRMMGSFAADVTAALGTRDVTFMRLLLPAIVTCVGDFLASKHAQGMCACVTPPWLGAVRRFCFWPRDLLLST